MISDRQTDEWTDICNCRVAFATENIEEKESIQYTAVASDTETEKCATGLLVETEIRKIMLSKN